MAWFSRKPDPLSERARALNSEIAHLESEIKRLDGQLQRQAVSIQPASVLSEGEPSARAMPAAVLEQPIFEEVDVDRLQPRPEPASTPEHYNDLGVRKYDLPALLRRVRNHFRGPVASNPRLVSYLAAGGIQGLRPMRYERRVARNRFIALSILLFLTLLGIIAVFVRNL